MARNFDQVVSAWAILTRELGALGPIESDGDLERVVGVLDEVLDVVRGDPGHSLQGLVSMLADLIERYEDQRLGESCSTPAEVLRLLMDSNNLTQADLAIEVGGQPVVSAILNGRREVNARQAAALAARFNVSPALFIASVPPSAQALPRPSFSTSSMEHVIVVQSGSRAYLTKVSAMLERSGVLPNSLWAPAVASASGSAVHLQIVH